MGQSQTKTTDRDAAQALAHLEEALSILDELDIPADVGAHVDLAICRLRDRLEGSEDA